MDAERSQVVSIDIDDLATVGGGVDLGAAAISLFPAAIGGLVSWSAGTGMGLGATIFSGIQKWHGPGTRLGNRITTGTGVVLGLAGAYASGKGFYNLVTEKH
jgi:hypothetical protein